MTEGRRSGGGFTGHPAIIFWLMTDYGKDVGIQLNLTILDKLMYQLDAVLHTRPKYETDFEPDLDDIAKDLADAWSYYHPEMEKAGFAIGEKELIMHMRTIYSKLCRLTAKGHVCDYIEFQEREVMG